MQEVKKLAPCLRQSSGFQNCWEFFISSTHEGKLSFFPATALECINPILLTFFRRTTKERIFFFFFRLSWFASRDFSINNTFLSARDDESERARPSPLSVRIGWTEEEEEEGKEGEVEEEQEEEKEEEEGEKRNLFWRYWFSNKRPSAKKTGAIWIVSEMFCFVYPHSAFEDMEKGVVTFECCSRIEHLPHVSLSQGRKKLSTLFKMKKKLFIIFWENFRFLGFLSS